MKVRGLLSFWVSTRRSDVDGGAAPDGSAWLRRPACSVGTQISMSADEVHEGIAARNGEREDNGEWRHKVPQN
jgi:hypothetical protein